MPLQDHSSLETSSTLIGREPSWLIRSGTGMIFVVFLVLLLLTYFIKYPDTLSANIILTTSNPPVNMVAKVNGQIRELNTRNGEYVDKGDVLLVLESDVELKRLDNVESILRPQLADDESFRLSQDSVRSLYSFELGILQAPLNNVISSAEEYLIFARSDRIDSKMDSQRIMLQRYQALLDQLKEKRTAWQEKLRIETEHVEKNTNLAKSGVLASSNLTPLRSNLINENMSFRDLEIQIELNKVEMEQHRIQLTELASQKREQHARLLFQLRQALQYFYSQANIWKTQYVMVAPISGKVSMSSVWGVNQYLSVGDTALVIADHEEPIIGKMTVSHLGAGKVSVGQRVNIELQSYPSHEFGKLQGEVVNISQVPDDKGYSVDVSLRNGLVTSYSKEVPFAPHLLGSGSVITQDKRLIERFFEKILQAFDQ